jgi:hemerythrin-like metal-binding protein
MPALNDSDLPETDLESMNRDHRDQVAMITAVVDAIAAYDASEASSRVVDEAVEDFAAHTREHFSQEQDQMRRYAFPAFEMHDAEHQRALARMDEVIAAWSADRDAAALRVYFGEEFPKWLVAHVSAMDVFAAQYVAGNAH